MSPPRRGSALLGRRSRLCLCLAVVLLACSAFLPAASYSSTQLDRPANLNVTTDQNAVLGASTPILGFGCGQQRFLTLRNRFGETTSVRVDLLTGNGELYYDRDDDGTREAVGESVTVTLGNGPVSVSATKDSDSNPSYLAYRAVARTDGTTLTLEPTQNRANFRFFC